MQLIKLSDEQSILFVDTNLPPIFSPDAPEHGVVKVDTQMRKLNKGVLNNLEELYMNSDGNIGQLQAQTQEANISITETKGMVGEG